MEDVINFLNDLAAKLDSWAEQSRCGGWSTHQVEANEKTANDCRRFACQLSRR